MPAGERPTVPLPPSAPPSSLPALDEHALEEGWRIQRPGNPLRPRRRAHGRFRFDAPAGEYPVTYVNLDRHACYAEVFGDAREIPPSAADRRLFRLRAARPLRVIALTGLGSKRPSASTSTCAAASTTSGPGPGAWPSIPGTPRPTASGTWAATPWRT